MVRQHGISIHALREEGDMMLRDHDKNREPISIHALREEGDEDDESLRKRVQEFLSTPSARRATLDVLVGAASAAFLSTPSARRATWQILVTVGVPSDFYPRPPRGGRPLEGDKTYDRVKFLSTPSARRATQAAHRAGRHGEISIHALREEGDREIYIQYRTGKIFLSTPSARRATPIGPPPFSGYRFLSTPSARRATLFY